jgi:hypothetical protein
MSDVRFGVASTTLLGFGVASTTLFLLGFGWPREFIRKKLDQLVHIHNGGILDKSILPEFSI